MEPKLERVQGLCSRQSPLVCGYRVGQSCPVAALRLSGVSARLQGGKALGSSASLVVAALGGGVEGPEAASKRR